MRPSTQAGIFSSFSTEKRPKLDGVSNFLSSKPNLEAEGLKMAKFWFENANKDLKNKRSHEELLVTLN
jgi:hypothetical protein